MKKPGSPSPRIRHALAVAALPQVSGGNVPIDPEPELARKGKKNPSDQAGA